MHVPLPTQSSATDLQGTTGRRHRHRCHHRASRSLPPDREHGISLPALERWGHVLQKTLQDIEGFGDAHNAALEKHLESAQWLLGRGQGHTLPGLQKQHQRLTHRQGVGRGTSRTNNRPGSEGNSQALRPDVEVSLSTSTSALNSSRRSLEQSSLIEQSSREGRQHGVGRALPLGGPGTPPRDGMWVACGALLVVGAVLPAIVECALYEDVMQLESDWRLALVLLTDSTFVATTFAFLLSGEVFGRQRYQRPQSYPGPWVELNGDVTQPSHFFFYLVGFPALIGLLMPVAAIAYAHSSTEHGQLTTLALAPYLATLLVQIYTEKLWMSRGSFMWPMVPVVHMLYRFWQLGRGCALVSILHGPQWLILLQAVLTVLWTFNFGAVMAWMPWLYRWQCQPTLAEPADDSEPE